MDLSKDIIDHYSEMELKETPDEVIKKMTLLRKTEVPILVMEELSELIQCISKMIRVDTNPTVEKEAENKKHLLEEYVDVIYALQMLKYHYNLDEDITDEPDTDGLSIVKMKDIKIKRLKEKADALDLSYYVKEIDRVTVRNMYDGNKRINKELYDN